MTIGFLTNFVKYTTQGYFYVPLRAGLSDNPI